MNMYKTILVPLDGSKRAERILPHVEEVAQYNEASVIFLQVIEPHHYYVGPHGAVMDVKLINDQEKDAEEYLTTLRGEFREKGIKAKFFIERGPVVKRIIDVADRENADLIAMASHGRTGLSHVFYGSVAAGVLHRIDRPLLLVRAEGSS
jgi:nucleotide-binding universal stress UspA family protein